MVYIDIPFVNENKRIDRVLIEKELQSLTISEEAKKDAFDAIYNRLPRGVEFDSAHLSDAVELQNVLRRLGVPYRQIESSEFI